MPLTESQPDAAARLYARSLIELCNAGGGRPVVEETLGELEEVLELARSDRKFAELLSSRAIATDARAESLKRIFSNRITERTLRFMLVLNEKGRISDLPAMVDAFENLVQAQFGRIEVDVYTADPADAATLTDLGRKLQSALGKEVILHPYTEPAMLGGIKYRIGDQLVDASVATRLRRMHDQLSGPGTASMRASTNKILGN